MMDTALEQGNIDIRKTKALLHRMYERTVDEIIVAFSPFLDALYHLEKAAPKEGRKAWLKRERRKLVEEYKPGIDMLNIIRRTQRQAYGVALAPMRDIYLRNFLYIISEVKKEIELTEDLLLDMWTEGLLNDYDELIEESEKPHTDNPEAAALARWRESLYDEKPGRQAMENFLHAVPIIHGDIVKGMKRGIREVVATTERHTSRFVDGVDSHFTSAGRVEAGTQLTEEYGVDLVKVWVCTFENSRDSHMQMHLQDRQMDEDFISGLGNVLRFPGDMLAPIEDWINCKCYVVILTPEELEKMKETDLHYKAMQEGGLEDEAK